MAIPAAVSRRRAMSTSANSEPGGSGLTHTMDRRATGAQNSHRADRKDPTVDLRPRSFVVGVRGGDAAQPPGGPGNDAIPFVRPHRPGSRSGADDARADAAVDGEDRRPRA